MNNSKLALIQAFKEVATHSSIDKITVEAVISVAGVSRQTFYKYFNDKFDLAFQLFTWDHSRYVNEDDDFVARQLAHLKMLQDGQAYYRNIMRDSHLQESFMKRRFDYCIEATVAVIGKKKIDHEMRLVLETWITGTEMLFEKWVLDRCREEKETIINVFIKTMPEILRPYLL